MPHDSKDPPIETREYAHGVTVVDFGDLRVARGQSRRSHPLCAHKRLVYDKQERRIWCADCERNYDPFDAFMQTIEQFDRASKSLQERLDDVRAAETHAARSLAVKSLDEVWRGRSMAPCCPHCSRGLLPEDFSAGIKNMVNRELETRRRRPRTRST